MPNWRERGSGVGISGDRSRTAKLFNNQDLFAAILVAAPLCAVLWHARIDSARNPRQWLLEFSRLQCNCFPRRSASASLKRVCSLLASMGRHLEWGDGIHPNTILFRVVNQPLISSSAAECGILSDATLSMITWRRGRLTADVAGQIYLVIQHTTQQLYLVIQHNNPNNGAQHDPIRRLPANDRLRSA